MQTGDSKWRCLYMFTFLCVCMLAPCSLNFHQLFLLPMSVKCCNFTSLWPDSHRVFNIFNIFHKELVSVVNLPKGIARAPTPESEFVWVIQRDIVSFSVCYVRKLEYLCFSFSDKKSGRLIDLRVDSSDDTAVLLTNPLLLLLLLLLQAMRKQKERERERGPTSCPATYQNGTSWFLVR